MPFTVDEWQLTILDAQEESSITSIIGGTYTPKAGRTFLVLDILIRALDPTSIEDISTKEFAVIDSSGEIHTADAAGWDGTIFCAGCSFSTWYDMEGGTSSFTLVYVVPSGQIDEPFDLQYGRAPTISFEVGARPDIPYTTEIDAGEGHTPFACDFGELEPLGEDGVLTVKQWEDDSLLLSAMKPDGSMVGSCAGIAYGDLAFADDGAVLMTLGPFQGWPDLSLAEPDGKVTDLVQNAVDTAALFSQSGRYIFFTVITLDDSDEEALYVFDREEGSAELLKEGDSINFALLADGQLLVSVKEDDDTEVFMAEADSTDLEQLSLPDEANYSSVQSDGKHVIYALEKGSAWKLFLAGLDGGGEQELASYSDSRSKPSGMLSPNGQFALLNLRDTGDEWYVEFRDLSSDEGEAIVSDINRLRFDFSPDSRWAYVVSFKRSDADSDWETTLFVIDTSTSEVVQEIDDVINAAFSPDGSQLAYTLGAEDDAEVFIIDLGGDGETSLDEGRLGGWYP